MGKIFGDELIAEIASQDDALASKSGKVTVVDDGIDFSCSLQMYHNSRGQPFYLTSISWFFKKRDLDLGDVVLFVPSGLSWATLHVMRSSDEEARRVHAAVGFDLQAELAKVGVKSGAKRSAEGTPEQSSAKKAAATLTAPANPGVQALTPANGAARIPPAAPIAIVNPVVAAARPAPAAPARAAPRPTAAPPAAAANSCLASIPPTIAAIATQRLPQKDAADPSALLATATMALSDASFRVPETQMAVIYTWYRGMAIARKARLEGYAVGSLSQAAITSLSAAVSAELEAMAPRERDELVMKCYLGSYKYVLEIKKSVSRQAVLDVAVASWKGSTREPVGVVENDVVTVHMVEKGAEPVPKQLPAVRKEVREEKQGPLSPLPKRTPPPAAAPKSPVAVSRLVVHQKPVAKSAPAPRPSQPARPAGTWNAQPQPQPQPQPQQPLIIRSRPAAVISPAAGEPRPRSGSGLQLTTPSNSKPATYLPPPKRNAAAAAAVAVAGKAFARRLAASPEGAHALQELRSALAAARNRGQPAPASAAPAQAPPPTLHPPPRISAPTPLSVPPRSAFAAAPPPAAPAPAAAQATGLPFLVMRSPLGPNPGSRSVPVEVLDGDWMMSHLRTVAVLESLASAFEGLRDAIKASFVNRNTAPHERVLGAVEGVIERVEGAALAVRKVANGQVPGGAQEELK